MLRVSRTWCCISSSLYLHAVWNIAKGGPAHWVLGGVWSYDARLVSCGLARCVSYDEPFLFFNKSEFLCVTVYTLEVTHATVLETHDTIYTVACLKTGQLEPGPPG